MKSTEIQFTCVLLLLGSATRAEFRKCGEFDHSEIVRHAVKKYSEPMPFEQELEEILDAFENKDNERMEEIFNKLENETFTIADDAPTAYKENVIKYVPDRIKSEGYPSEVHQVQTEDGYILQLHRIPYGRHGETDKQRPPIFLMHGFLESSNGWIVLGPDNSLAYMLADAGYDVWMGNARGTENSCKHTHLNPNGFNQKEFWSFSWHEIGYYDLPAFIDYILNVTKHDKLNYIGFSQGTTTFLVMASMRPEYNNKIIEANLLAPVAFLRGTTHPIYTAVAQYYKPIKRFAETMRLYKVTLNNQLVMSMGKIACKKSAHSTPLTCKLVLSLFDSNQINCTSLPFILVNTPAGISMRQALHFLQIIRFGVFRQFDYENKRINRKVYGTDAPPAYNLAKVTAPVNLYHSKDDNTAVIDNVMRLKAILPNVKSTYLIPFDDFTHVDFTFSRYARTAINDHIIGVIGKVYHNHTKNTQF